MTEEDLKSFLHEQNLTLIKFAEILNTPLATVQKWGKSSKVPPWLESFIYYYLKNKELEELKSALNVVKKIIE